MTQEALKLALDALETELSIDWTNNDEFNESAKKMYEAIAAIKEALAQEPVKIVQYNCTCGRTMKFESVHGVVAPQRTWVGLTEGEQVLLARDYGDTPLTLIYAVGNMLKEKNSA